MSAAIDSVAMLAETTQLERMSARRHEAGAEAIGILMSLQDHNEIPSHAKELVRAVIAKWRSGSGA